MSVKRRTRVLDDSDDSDIEVKRNSPVTASHQATPSRSSKSASPKKQTTLMGFLSKTGSKGLTQRDFFGELTKLPTQDSSSASKKKRKPTAAKKLDLTDSASPSTASKRQNRKSQNTDKPATPSRNNRKRKLSEAQSEEGAGKGGSESSKRRKWNGPRTDNPPMQGLVEIPQGKPNCLSNMRFVITGQLPSLTREDAGDLIKSLGGKVTSAVSGMTRYLVAGTEPGQSKMQKAKDKGVTIIDEAQLLEMIRTLPAGKEPKSKAKKKPSTARSKTAALSTRSVSSLSSSSSLRGSNQMSSSSAMTGVSDLNQSGSLAVDYFAPKSTADLIGNQSNIKAIRDYLTGFDTQLSNGGPKFKKRAALVSGPPGIGKSSAVSLVCKECGYDIIEFNASDTRSRKELEIVVAQSLNAGSLRRYFRPSGGAACSSPSLKKAVVMDEVDGMSSGDRGGMAKLIDLIKKTRVPIITICNDRSHPKIRSLVNYCTDIRFRRPTATQIAGRIAAISERLGLLIDRPSIEKIASGTHSDIRQVIQLLQFWSCDGSRSGLSYSEVKKRVEQDSHKDVTRGPWDVVPKLLSQRVSVNEGIDSYFVDQSLVPLMVFENYLRIQPEIKAIKTRRGTVKQCSLDQLTLIEKGCRYTADFDLLDSAVRRTQYYGLMPGCAALSCVAAPQMLSQVAHRSGRIEFPSWLGKNSKRNKNLRLLRELASHMNAQSVNASAENLASEYLCALKNKIVRPLANRSSISKDEANEVVTAMNEYGLTREDWDSVAELGFGPKYNVVGKCKGAFTRACTAGLHSQADSAGGRRKAKVSAMPLSLSKAPLLDADGLALSEDDNDEDNEEETKSDDISDNGLIKVVKSQSSSSKKKRRKKK